MTYTLKGFGPLISLLPYQFGFAPTGSYVIAFFDGHTLDVCLRFDADEVTSHPQDLVQLCTQLQTRRTITNAILIAYELGDAGEGEEAEQALIDLLSGEGLPTHHRLIVRDGRWRAYACDFGCCSTDWQVIEQPRDVAPVAEMVMCGRAPLPSRAEALEVLDRRDPVSRKKLERAVARLDALAMGGTGDAQAAGCAWCEFMSDAGVDHELLAGVLIRLRDARCRDTALRSILPELMEGQSTTFGAICLGHGRAGCRIEDESRCLHQLLEALPAIPEQSRATWLCLIALARWRSGDQSGAGMAASRAMDQEPSLSLARLCSMILETRRPYDDFRAAPNRATSSL